MGGGLRLGGPGLSFAPRRVEGNRADRGVGGEEGVAQPKPAACDPPWRMFGSDLPPSGLLARDAQIRPFSEWRVTDSEQPRRLLGRRTIRTSHPSGPQADRPTFGIQGRKFLRSVVCRPTKTGPLMVRMADMPTGPWEPDTSEKSSLFLPGVNSVDRGR